MTVLDRTSPSLSRRGFLGGAVGLTFAFTLTGLLSGRPQAVLAAAGAQERTLGAWVTIRPDGGVVIAAPAAEMGQGVFTALPMILAEEMDADWQKVEPIFAPAVPEKYGNPGFGGGMITVGSRAVSGYWTPLRLQGAAVRRFLMQSAADEWGVPIGEVSTEPGAVVHSASGRRITYGEIAGTVEPPEALPEIGEADLKDPADFRIIGQNVPRFDLPLKVDGSARYGIDAAVPGMVYATVLRAPVAGAEIGSVNRAEIEGWDGILQAVELPHTVAVVGETVEAVFAARQALVVE